MREVMLDEFGIGVTLSDRILSLMIGAVQSNIAHNDAKQEVSGDGGGESLPEYIEKKMQANISANQDYLAGDGSGEYLPEVSQEDRDSDGWIDWGGGDCPVDPELYVFVEFRNDSVTDSAYKAGSYEWRRDIVERSWDIVAYKVAK